MEIAPEATCANKGENILVNETAPGVCFSAKTLKRRMSGEG